MSRDAVRMIKSRIVVWLCRSTSGLATLTSTR